MFDQKSARTGSVLKGGLLLLLAIGVIMMLGGFLWGQVLGAVSLDAVLTRDEITKPLLVDIVHRTTRAYRRAVGGSFFAAGGLIVIVALGTLLAEAIVNRQCRGNLDLSNEAPS